MIDVVAQVTLSVRPEGAMLPAVLQIRNVGKDAIPLFTHNLPVDGVLSNDVFSIITEDEAQQTWKALYTGPYIKRAAPQVDDFVMLPPGEEISFHVELTSFYQIPNANGRRRAHYEAYHGDAQIFGRLWKLRSNEAGF